MNTTGHNHSIVKNIIFGASLIPIVSLVVLYSIIIYKIYLKHKSNMEPMIVFLLNFMAVLALRPSFLCIVTVLQFAGIGKEPEDSCPY